MADSTVPRFEQLTLDEQAQAQGGANAQHAGETEHALGTQQAPTPAQQPHEAPAAGMQPPSASAYHASTPAAPSAADTSAPSYDNSMTTTTSPSDHDEANSELAPAATPAPEVAPYEHSASAVALASVPVPSEDAPPVAKHDTKTTELPPAANPFADENEAQEDAEPAAPRLDKGKGKARAADLDEKPSEMAYDYPGAAVDDEYAHQQRDWDPPRQGESDGYVFIDGGREQEPRTELAGRPAPVPLDRRFLDAAAAAGQDISRSPSAASGSASGSQPRESTNDPEAHAGAERVAREQSQRAEELAHGQQASEQGQPLTEQQQRPREEEEEAWPLKTIAWPPMPPVPSAVANGGEGHPAMNPSSGYFGYGGRVRVLCQNNNGPCSLLALANVLILRGELHLPPHLEHVSYTHLSALLADKLLSGATSATVKPENVESILSLLPTMRQGLTLNPRFASIDGFAPHASRDLFSAFAIPLVHGWVCDPDAAGTPAAGGSDEWAALVDAGQGDYDDAVMRMLEGFAIRDDPAARPELDDSARAILVAHAYAIESFLEQTRTQLTYPGLLALSTSLPRGSLAAFFHNEHVAVLYRRLPLPDEMTGAASGVPELFTLVTDESFVADDVAWESLADVDGQATEFFDGALRRVRRNADWLPAAARRRHTEDAHGGRDYGLVLPPEILREQQDASDADMQLARHLQRQEEEDMLAREHHHYRRAVDAQQRGRERGQQEALAQQQQAMQGGKRRFGGSKRQSTQVAAGGAEGSKKKDKDCIIM